MNSRIDADELRQACYGKWAGLYDHFGVDVGTGKHKACPICHGTDRFRCDGLARDGNYICNQCGNGQGFTMLMRFKGWTLPETIKKVSRVVGMVEKVEDKINLVDPGIALRHLYSTSKPLNPSDIASKYLRARGLVLTPKDLRYCPQCYESETKKKIPAMLAVIRDVAGDAISIHRTYLQGTSKADIKSPRKMMPPKKPLAGSAIRLFDPDDSMFEDSKDTLGLVEGIETGMSVAQLFNVATWACLSTSLLESFEPPKNINIRKFVIYADSDNNYSGEKAAYSLANKLYLRDFLVEVVVPETKGFDWNDVLLENLK